MDYTRSLPAFIIKYKESDRRISSPIILTIPYLKCKICYNIKMYILILQMKFCIFFLFIFPQALITQKTLLRIIRLSASVSVYK